MSVRSRSSVSGVAQPGHPPKRALGFFPTYSPRRGSAPAEHQPAEFVSRREGPGVASTCELQPAEGEGPNAAPTAGSATAL